MLQVILYNQIHERFLHPDAEKILYVHFTWNITFLWKTLQLNTDSKILDYAMGKDFIERLKEKGLQAFFICAPSYRDAIYQYMLEQEIQECIIVKPNENYVYENFLKIQTYLSQNNKSLRFIEDDQSFLLSHEDFLREYKKPPIMEYFYRFMRKKFHILIDENNQPLWGVWNFDSENRKFDAKHSSLPKFQTSPTSFLIEAEHLYDKKLEHHIPTNVIQAKQLLNYFLEYHAYDFGRLEDAMYTNDPFVHHSLLSTAINFWLLSPKEVIDAICERDIPIESKEWFVRQILWWREYMYHFFQFYKNDIYQQNFFSYQTSLPDFFRWKNMENLWLNCLKTVLSTVQKYHYSHHIERLMIIWNFSLLMGYHPRELNQWFFEMYTDAFEWVVSPNVLSMSQYADGWLLATKPYVSSGNYIHKMSNYCEWCQYDIKEKYSENACPFNYLYWAFVDENKEHLQKKRQSFIIKQLQNIDIKKIQELKQEFQKKCI